MQLRDGGVIATGFDAELDELRAIRPELRRLPARPGGARTRAHRHPNLRVQYNKVHGFYIEVTAATSTRCPTTTAAARR